jgi:pSer/pThr/pTyr-binding forkhead associated (FHA) protein
VPTLRVYRDDEFVRDFELPQSRVRLGRGVENEVVLEDQQKRISRTHAEIRYERGSYVIADLNSQNGVWIGERQITSERLPVDVPVTLGPYRVVLLPEPEPLPAAIPPAEATMLEEVVVEPTQIAEAVPMRPSGGTQPPPSARTQPPLSAQSQTPASARSQAPPSARSQATKTTPAPPPRRSLLIPIVSAIAVLVIAVAVVSVFRRHPEPPTPVAATTSSIPPAPATTTTIPPAESDAERQFKEKYDEAQSLIALGKKSEAMAANDAALALLPQDSRGLKQHDDIQLMPAAAPTPPATAGPPAPPPVPETLRVQAKPGESEKDRSNREKYARANLADAKQALNDREYDKAINLSAAAINGSGRADFGNTAGEASAVNAKAKSAKAEGEAKQRRGNAQKLIDDATAIGASDIPAAVEKVRQATRLDANVEGGSELLANLLPQARAQGEQALRDAKALDNARRREPAVAQYQKAVQLLQLLPDGHPELEFARGRITALKGQ